MNLHEAVRALLDELAREAGSGILTQRALVLAGLVEKALKADMDDTAHVSPIPPAEK